MVVKTPAVLGLLLSVTVLLGSVTLTGAAPQKKKPGKPAAGAALVAAGKKVYDEKRCSACHKIGDKGSTSGPELTKIGATQKAAWLTVQIRDPKKHKADGTMPAYDSDGISDKNLKALVAYLGSLK